MEVCLYQCWIWHTFVGVQYPRPVPFSFFSPASVPPFPSSYISLHFHPSPPCIPLTCVSSKIQPGVLGSSVCFPAGYLAEPKPQNNFCKFSVQKIDCLCEWSLQLFVCKAKCYTAVFSSFKNSLTEGPVEVHLQPPAFFLTFGGVSHLFWDMETFNHLTNPALVFSKPIRDDNTVVIFVA